jgi:hypothetical protein
MGLRRSEKKFMDKLTAQVEVFIFSVVFSNLWLGDSVALLTKFYKSCD